MIPVSTETMLRSDNIYLDDLLDEVVRLKWWILLAAAISALVGWTIGAISDRKYEARVVVSPVSESSQGSAGGLSSLARLGDLASMVGISGLSGSRMRDEVVAVLMSQALTAKYIEENKLLPLLYSRKWDRGKNTWKIDDPAHKPSLWKATQYFNNGVRSVAEDRRTGLITLTVRWKDPVLAAQWANGLVALSNSYLRSRAIEEAERSIAYLNEEASKASIVEVRTALFSLLQSELNTIMIARARPEYALRVIDPAEVAEKPSSLPPWILAIAGFFLGGVLGVLLAVGRRLVTTPAIRSMA